MKYDLKNEQTRECELVLVPRVGPVVTLCFACLSELTAGPAALKSPPEQIVSVVIYEPIECRMKTIH
jgi:hypothetical protein